MDRSRSRRPSEQRWLHYADPALAPMCRSVTGSNMPITPWPQCADHALAPLCRSSTGSYVPVGDSFYREGLAASAQAARKGRCFIATCVFGEGWQTQVLRGFRDVALRSNAWGRRVIWFYYRVAPGICKCLRRWPALQAPVSVVLGAMAACLRWWPGLRGGGKCRR
ncbi:MAG: CFI-box-CTERM domain-containing protein [Pseudomonadota bacterium]